MVWQKIKTVKAFSPAAAAMTFAERFWGGRSVRWLPTGTDGRIRFRLSGGWIEYRVDHVKLDLYEIQRPFNQHNATVSRASGENDYDMGEPVG